MKHITLMLLMPVIIYAIPHFLGMTTPKEGWELFSEVFSYAVCIGFFSCLILWIKEIT